jgi:hypothetical protein
MRITRIVPAIALGLLAVLLMAAPAGAASTGTICGELTGFTAPTAVSNGSLAIDGSAETIDNSASGAIDALTRTLLSALALADTATCLEVEANEDGDIVDVALASRARICGTVDADTTTGGHTVDGLAIAPSALSGDAEASAVLDAAADAGANTCINVAVDVTDGAIASAGIDTNFTVCGAVTAEGDGDANVAGTEIDQSLLQNDASGLLGLAAATDGTACVTVSAVSSGTQTSVTVGVEVDVCAEVTGVSEDSVTLEGVELLVGGGADGEFQVGDVVCVTAGTRPSGDGVITDPDGAPVSLLPDTAIEAVGVTGWMMLIGLGLIGVGAALVVGTIREKLGR